MSFGKGSVPDPPDYTALASSNEKAAELYSQLGQDQLTFYKDQYNTYLPYVTDYLQSTTDTSDENRTRAKEYYDFYKDQYRPLEQTYVGQVTDYMSPARSNQLASQAMADVGQQYTQKRDASLASLESYGIDPSQTRWGALDLSSRLSEAAATAAAGTLSRQNTEKTGLALEAGAINTGRGYAQDTSGAYDTATKAGGSGISSATNLYSASGSTMGQPSSYFSNSNTAYSNEGSALNMGYQDALSSYSANRANSQDTWKGIGSLAGGALGYFL